MADKSNASKKEPVSLEKSLTGLGQKVHQAKATRPGTIVFHTSGAGGGSYGLDTGQGQTRVIKFAETIRERPPLLELIGDIDRSQFKPGDQVQVRVVVTNGLETSIVESERFRV